MLYQLITLRKVGVLCCKIETLPRGSKKNRSILLFVLTECVQSQGPEPGTGNRERKAICNGSPPVSLLLSVTDLVFFSCLKIDSGQRLGGGGNRERAVKRCKLLVIR